MTSAAMLARRPRQPRSSSSPARAAKIGAANAPAVGVSRSERGARLTLERYRADAVVTCDAEFRIHAPGIVDVADGRISWVGPPEEAPDIAGASQDSFAGLLMPGLVNVHGHAPMTLFRGAGEDMTLERWLRDVLWPREALLADDDVYWGMTLACGEMLRAGVTTSCEMYIFEEAMLEAAVDAGSRCVITPGVIEVPAWQHFKSWSERLKAVLAFHDRYAGAHDRIEVGIGPHSAYALPTDALAACAAAARERDALLNLHVAESRTEAARLEQEHGMSVPFLLERLGCLEGRVLAAHCVWLTDDDLRLFADRGVAIAHCPQSNAKLANGVAPLADMVGLGVAVGLGTDGAASNNNLDLWEELRLAPLLARLRSNDARAISVIEALALGTRGGARALGRDDIGSLESGRWADMLLLRLDDPVFVPRIQDRDLLTHLTWSASSRLVSDVWVAGTRVVRDGECVTVDEERARAEVEARAGRLAARVAPATTPAPRNRIDAGSSSTGRSSL